MNEPYSPPVDLGYLSSLGFGPGSPLMNEPRLLIEPRFLGAVMVELESELGSAQPAVSQRIKALQAYLGVTLYEAPGGKVRLTPEGQRAC